MRWGALELDAVLLGKLLDAALGVNELALPGVERVALRADLDPDVLPGGSGHERLPAGARHGRLLVVWVDALLHRRIPSAAAPKSYDAGPVQQRIIPQLWILRERLDGDDLETGPSRVDRWVLHRGVCRGNRSRGPGGGSWGPLQEEGGIERDAVAAYLKEEMRAGAPSGASHSGDDLALGHLVAHRDQDRGEVGVAGFESIRVGQDEEPAVPPLPACEPHDPVFSRQDRGPGSVRDVDPGVELAGAEDGMDPPSEPGGDPAFRWPQHRPEIVPERFVEPRSTDAGRRRRSANTHSMRAGAP